MPILYIKTAARFKLIAAVCCIALCAAAAWVYWAFGSLGSSSPHPHTAEALKSAAAVAVKPASAAPVGVVSANSLSGSPNAGPNRTTVSSAEPLPFATQEFVPSMKDFFERMLSEKGVTQQEREEFIAKLLLTVETSTAAADLIKEFYRSMPAEAIMERDMFRQMLAGSQAGRELVVQEALNTWTTRNEKLYPEMYESFFNLPGVAPRDVFLQAISSLGADHNQRSNITAMNFLGTLSKETFTDVDRVKQMAIDKLQQLANQETESVIQALAVQKLIRLSTPNESANIAMTYLAQRPSTDLVMQVIYSVSNGEIEYNANVRYSLANATKRPGAAKEEVEAFKQLRPAS